MAIQLSTAVRNARLDAIPTAIGASAILKVLSGAMPVNCAAANSGTVLATLNLPAAYFAPAANGAKAMTGTWEDTAADASGTAGYFRIYDPTGATCHLQGTVTATGGGGDMTVDNTNFAAGQDFKVTSFTLADGNG